jgi:hypothetical protein
VLTPQAPIGSCFGARSTASDVIRGIDLTGKNVVVTGAIPASASKPSTPFARLARRSLYPHAT